MGLEVGRTLKHKWALCKTEIARIQLPKLGLGTWMLIKIHSKSLPELIQSLVLNIVVWILQFWILESLFELMQSIQGDIGTWTIV